MEKISFQTLITNRVFLNNLIVGLKEILKATQKTEEVEKRFTEFQIHLRNLIFSASRNDENINRSLLRTKAFTDYSITPGYPGSFLSYVINVVREHNFILMNSLDQLSSPFEFNKRSTKLKTILQKIIDVEEMPEDRKARQEKERDIWNGALNVDYSNQTIDSIFKNPGLKEIFSDILKKVIKDVDKDLESIISINKVGLAPEDVDQDIGEDQLTNIINVLKTEEDNFIKSKISFSIGNNILSESKDTKENSKIKSWKLLTDDFFDPNCKISSSSRKILKSKDSVEKVNVLKMRSNIKDKFGCNNLIELYTGGNLNIIGNMSGITISNRNMSNILDGVLCIKNYNIIIQKPDSSKVRIKLNQEKSKTLDKDVVKMNLCHAVILLNKKEKKLKFFVKGKKCCVDNIFKIIGYNNWLNDCL